MWMVECVNTRSFGKLPKIPVSNSRSKEARVEFAVLPQRGKLRLAADEGRVTNCLRIS